MKTPYKWKLEFEKNLENFEKDYVPMIEAIQKDALSDTMADTTSDQEYAIMQAACNSLERENQRLTHNIEIYRQRWLDARKHLRAANKGAERNAIVIQLLTARHTLLINPPKP